MLPMEPKIISFGCKTNKTTSFCFFKHLDFLVQWRHFDCFAPKQYRFHFIGNIFGELFGHCIFSLFQNKIVYMDHIGDVSSQLCTNVSLWLSFTYNEAYGLQNQFRLSRVQNTSRHFIAKSSHVEWAEYALFYTRTTSTIPTISRSIKPPAQSLTAGSVYWFKGQPPFSASAFVHCLSLSLQKP